MRERLSTKAVGAGLLAAALLVVFPVTFPPGAACADGYGVLRTAGSGSGTIWVLNVGGTRYEMGYWYGLLLADQIAGCLASLSAALPFSEADYNAAIAAMWNPAYFDTAAYESELQGMADGCAAGGHPEVTFAYLRKMQLIADMSELGCSLFAAWGNATADGHLYQLRNLDWSMTTGAQDYPVVAIYDPDDGHAHAVIGFAGALGVSGGGLSENGIAQSQIMGYFCDPETLNGIPFPFLLRDILYHDATLAQGLNRIQTATRTNNYYYGLSGPDGPEITGRLLLTSNTRCDIYADNESVNPHPCISPSPFHTSLDDVVYWRRHDGGGNDMFYNALNARYGNIDSVRSIEIAQIVGVSGTLLSVVYDATAGECWVAYANGTDPAHNQGYVHVELTTYNKLDLNIVNEPWGSVQVDPNDPNLPADLHPAGIEVTLTATPIEGKGLKHWQIFDPNHPGDANHAAIDANNPITLLMDTDREVTAVFKCGSSIGPLMLVILGVLGLSVWARRRE